MIAIPNRILFCFFSLALFAFSNAGAITIKTDSIYPLTTYVHFGEKEGLTSKTIYCVIQDKDGFIWMGSDAGVFRYDGKNFKQFTTGEGISDNEVFNIYQDHLGRIWFLTFNGHLSYWFEGKIYNEGNTPFLRQAYSGGPVRTCMEDKSGRLWFGMELHGFVLIDKEKVKKVIIEVDGLDLPPYHVLEDGQRNIWTIYKRKLFKLLESNFKDTVVLHYPGNVNFFSYSKNSSDIYINSSRGIYKLSVSGISLLVDSTLVPPDKRISNIIGQGDDFWVCTSGEGCYEFESGKFKRRYVEDAYVSSVFKDREGNLWFSTIGKGLFMTPGANVSIANFNNTTGLSGNKITSVAMDGHGVLWLGYDNGVVDKIFSNKKSSFKLTLPDDQHYCRVTSLLVDSNYVWCGTDIGIFYINQEKTAYVPAVSPDGHGSRYSVKRLFRDNDGNIYAASHSSLLKVENTRVGHKALTSFPILMRIFSGVEYDSGKFLLAGMNGLFKYTPGKGMTEIKTDINMYSTRILDMKKDKDDLVLATGDGIFVLKDDKEVQHITRENGLSGNNCNKITISQDGIYISTTAGVSILQKENNARKVAEVLTMQNGMLSNFINDVASDDKRIYVASDEGLSVINKRDTFARKFIGKVMITEVVADTLHHTFGESFSLRGAPQRLVIRFAYPVFNPVNTRRIKYRLVNNIEDNVPWNYSRNNEVEFSSLNPGKFIFQLKPDVRNGEAPIVSDIYIDIQPLWYQTATARIIFGLVAVSCLGVLVWRITKLKYERRMKALKQRNLLESERNRIASDMHDDIGADLTHINMLANMAKIANGKTEQVVDKISAKSNEVLQKMDHIIWTLDSKHDRLPDLIYFIREQTVRFLEDTDIELTFETDGDIPDLTIDNIKRRNVSLVVKELVHNSVKHSSTTHISIYVYVKGTQLHILYRDYGKGYLATEVAHGLGHTTLKKRMEEINSDIRISAKPGEGVSSHLVIRLL